MPLSQAKGIVSSLRHELLSHLPALRTASITLGGPDITVIRPPGLARTVINTHRNLSRWIVRWQKAASRS